MVTVFNSDYGYAVVELFFSNRGNLCREVVVAVCADHEAAQAVCAACKLNNPERYFSAHRVV